MKLTGVLICIALLAAITQAKSVKWARQTPSSKITYASHRSTVRSSKIVGGSEAYAGQFPWQAGIYLDGNAFCGGSLISSRVVLTAAHCVEEIRDFAIYLGTTDIESSTDPTQYVTSSNATMHEFYDTDLLLNDIAIIVLPKDITGQDVAPIRLPARSQIGETFEGQYARASGWGRTSDSDTWITQYLKFVDLKILGNAECEAVYGDIINDSKICVDTAGGETSTCFGDSGGPLVVYEHDGDPTEVGITSFIASEGCAAGFPAGFTRVSEYLDWLEKHAGVTIRP